MSKKPEPIIHRKGFVSRLHTLTLKREEFITEQQFCETKIREFEQELYGLRTRIETYTKTTIPRYVRQKEELDLVISGLDAEINSVSPYAEEEIAYQIKKEKIVALRAALAELGAE
jgi:hypothetical protein